MRLIFVAAPLLVLLVACATAESQAEGPARPATNYGRVGPNRPAPMAEVLVALHRAIPDPDTISFYSMYAGMPVADFARAFEMSRGWKRCFAPDTGGGTSEGCHIQLSSTGLGQRLYVPWDAMRLLVSRRKKSAHISSFVVTRTYSDPRQAWDEYRTTLRRWAKSEKDLHLARETPPSSLDELCTLHAWIDEPTFAASLSTICINDSSGRRPDEIQLAVLMANREG